MGFGQITQSLKTGTVMAALAAPVPPSLMKMNKIEIFTFGFLNLVKG